ncbi:MAG: hypothetical protein K2H64_11265 [Desulfovibrio sp.]|nr:hypothetical protein [Desulfovibrio sp.]
MGFIQRGKEKIIEIAINKIAEKMVRPNLEGIGVVKEIRYKDKILKLTIELAGLENQPITVYASDIVIADDGSSVTVNKFESNMPFMQVGLNRFLAGQSFDVPEDARGSLSMAKKVLGL